MNLNERDLHYYQTLNQLVKKNSVVIFGSSFLKNIPVSELAQTFDLQCDMYNRSFTDLSVFDADELLKQCILPLSPRKLMLGLGETDLEHGSKAIPEIIDAYSKLVDTIQENSKNCRVMIISVCGCSDSTRRQEFNHQLELLAKRKKCTYIDITSSLTDSLVPVNAFHTLRLFALDTVTFSDAMAYI